MLFDNRTALVTGGSRGIGAAVAYALLSQGAQVLVTARSMESLEPMMATWMAEGLNAHAVVCDLSDSDVGERLSAAVEATTGSLDILVNNAGIGHAAPLARTSLDDYQRVMTINSTSVFLTTKAFMPGMASRGFGRIVNIASTASKVGAPYTAAYTASKHAVLGLTRVAAAELVETGVTANAVCPGFVDPSMTQQTLDNIVAKTGRSREEALAAILKQSGQRRLVTTDEVAQAVLSLCHPAASATNGQAIVVDGGVLHS